MADPDPATGSIEGVVKDADTGEPLIGATVVVTTAAGQQAEITDENGQYTITSLPPASDYDVTFYYDDVVTDRKGVAVTVGETTTVDESVKTTATRAEVIQIEQGGIEMGLGDDTYTEEEGAIVAYPEPRPLIEWSSWVRVGLGVASRAPSGVARASRPVPPSVDRHTAVDAALGADVTLPIALHGDLRAGVWAELATSAGPVLGGELQLQHHQRALALRAGGNTDFVTAALALGTLAPWHLWADGKTRYMTGIRVVASATRSLDDPRDWTLTGGVEFEPVGALRHLLR
jgi:hypothetical protein